MNYLLDTNIFLWFIHGDRALPLKFKEYIEDKENDIFISQASLWKIAIKFSIGKLKLKRPFQDLIPGVLKENDFSVLLINTSHIIRVAELPLIHRDPFDRMIFSQCSVERIELIYTDPVFNQYISQPR